MAPGFLAKIVKAAGSTSGHTRDRSSHSVDSPRSSTTTPSRSRAASSAKASVAPPVPAIPVGRTESDLKMSKEQIPTISTTEVDPAQDSDSTFPSVTVVPPSPLAENRDLSPSSSGHSLAARTGQQIDEKPNTNTKTEGANSVPRGRTIPASVPKVDNSAEDDLQTPTASKPFLSRSPSTGQHSRSLSRPQTPSQPSAAAPEPAEKQDLKPADTSMSALAVPEVRKKASNKSLKNQPPLPITVTHTRVATTPAPKHNAANSQEGPSDEITPIVESPKAMQVTELPNLLPQGHQTQSPSKQTSPTGSSLYLSSPRDTDSVSIISTATQNKEKRRPWRKSTPSRKPTGLASAIAASGLAMANHSLTSAQQAHFTAAAAAAAAQVQHQTTGRKLSNAGSPYVSPVPSATTRHTKSKSAELSPRSSKSNRSVRRAATSVQSDGGSEYHVDGHPDYYSGLEEDTTDAESGSESEDDLMDLDLGEEDIPVTGFAVASTKRNADFHELFPSVPEGDYLIEDYGCALQREILIQGRLYVSENHICFHANIFGWITDLIIPIHEIVHLEKKMTAFVIPNGIQISTRQAKYTFASFLSRDTTFDVIYNIWKLERPDDVSYLSEGRTSMDATSVDNAAGARVNGVPKALISKVTQCACGREGKHFPATAMDTIVPGTPDRIYNLMFASGFIKDFLTLNQKLLDVQMSDWAPTSAGSKLLVRNMSYVKPLNGSLGPKQTKCEIRDEVLHRDPEDYITTMTTTRTPDVPSGGVFAVKTRTCIMWATPVSAKVIVTTEVEWTGRSFIKAIIERSAIDGQKAYHADLEKAMRDYIKEHQSEFVPEGFDASAIAIEEQRPEGPAESAVEAKPSETTEEEEWRQRERDRNRRGLQWAWDTFDGAYQVAKQSTIGAIELVKDAWDQSSSTTILWFVIVFLVLSNLWTLMRVGSGKEDARRRKELKRIEERDRLVHGVVSALWEELGIPQKGYGPALGAALGDKVGYGASNLPSPSLPRSVADVEQWREDVSQLSKTLDAVEERLKVLRDGLKSIEGLDKLD